MPALLALALLASPPDFARTFSFWIGGERVGAVAVSREGAAFSYASTTVVRRGGALETRVFARRFERGARLPSTLALWNFPEGPRTCLDVEDEQTGKPGQVCGERRGARLTGTLLGEPFEADLDEAGGPREVRLPKQSVRFVQERGPLPLPAPRDLFAGGRPAGPLAPLEGAASARVRAEAEGCQVDAALGRATPARDEPLVPTSPGPLSDVARDATRGLASAWAASRRLAAFTSQAIADAPPELDEHDPAIAWKRRRAGCVGHAAVFGALAGALGLRSRIVYGVLVEDGRLYPHAWSEVEVGGRYYPLDPSRGGGPVGPEHVPLARSDDADPLRPGRCMLALPKLRWSVTTPPR